MWYRDTPPSVDQAKGMPIPVMNYSLGGDGGMTWSGVRKCSSIRQSLTFSSGSISTSIFITRYWSQNSSVMRRASVTARKGPKSGTGGVAPCKLWENARWVLTDPTKVGLLASGPADGCPFLTDDIFFTYSLTLSSMSLRLAWTFFSFAHPTKFPWSRSRRSSRLRRSA